MNKRMIVPLIFGLAGIAVLLSLGIWQMQRLAWKQNILSQIEARLAADATPLPKPTEEARDNRLKVSTSGTFQVGEIHVLTSIKGEGPGFRIIAPFLTDTGQRIMVDRGFVLEANKNTERPLGDAQIEGNLLWPNETDGYTPEPNLERNIWFARDTPKMAAALDTDPVLVVVKSVTPNGPTQPLPVTVNIANDHLEYAITWFSLAFVWFGMTLFLLWRIRSETKRN